MRQKDVANTKAFCTKASSSGNLDLPSEVERRQLRHKATHVCPGFSVYLTENPLCRTRPHLGSWNFHGELAFTLCTTLANHMTEHTKRSQSRSPDRSHPPMSLIHRLLGGCCQVRESMNPEPKVPSIRMSTAFGCQAILYSLNIAQLRISMWYLL